MIYYVYILRDPRKDNEPFYVGKGKDKRAQSHLNGKDETNPFKVNVIKKIRENGLEPLVEYFKENLSEDDAHSEEIRLIKQFGRRDLNLGPLTNLTDGGEGSSGYKWTQEMKDKKSEEMKDIPLPVDVKEKIAKSNTGKRRSAETRKRLSESHTGKTQSAESNKKRSDKLKGRSISSEQKKNLSENRKGKNNPMFGKESPFKGRVHSDDSKNKIKEARAKQTISDETRKKMSDAQKLRHQIRKNLEI